MRRGVWVSHAKVMVRQQSTLSQAAVSADIWQRCCRHTLKVLSFARSPRSLAFGGLTLKGGNLALRQKICHLWGSYYDSLQDVSQSHHMAELHKQKVDTRVLVETPEGVDFEFVVAGPGKRGLAFLMDSLIKFGVVALAMICMSFFVPFGEAAAGLGLGLWMTLSFFMDWFYHSFFETIWSGQTPGKRSQKLRVVRSNGTPITASSAIGRNFLLAADCQPSLVFGLYTVGLLSMLSNRRMQRVCDLIFDTMVIDEERERISRAAGVTHGVESIPRSECSGRYSVPERTLAVIERLFEGDRLISDGRREEIARPLSLSLRQRMGWEEAGPDPSNPHIYFQHAPNRHTLFLRRVLKTFAESENIEDRSSRMTRGMQSADTTLRSARPTSTSHSTVDRRVNLDDWLAEEESMASTGTAPPQEPRL